MARRTRMKRDEHGIPMGGGGEPCPTCAANHSEGSACPEEALSAAGWTRNGVSESDGKAIWLAPETARRRATRRKRAERLISAPLATFARDVAYEPLNHRISDGLKRIPPPDAPRSHRLDPQTYRLWITVANARLAGLTDDQIAGACDTDASLVTSLVTDPAFLYFESEYRAAVASSPQLLAARERLASLMLDAVDSLGHWVKKRDDHLWNASLSAARQILAANGVDTERKRVTSVSARATLTPGQVDRLLDAATRSGA